MENNQGAHDSPFIIQTKEDRRMLEMQTEAELKSQALPRATGAEGWSDADIGAALHDPENPPQRAHADLHELELDPVKASQEIAAAQIQRSLWHRLRRALGR